VETCANCEQKIGKLETPFVWNGEVVCAACHKNLIGDFPSPAESLPDPAPIKADPRACPHCKSADTKALYLIHEQGKTKSSLMGIADGGVSEFFIGASSSQSDLSKRAAPPGKASDVWVFFLLIMIAVDVTMAFCWSIHLHGGFSAESDANPASSAWMWSWTIIFAFLTIGCCTKILGGHRWNKKIWPALHASWRSMFMCQRCGMIFRPSRNP
jgi:hypothetical protein